VAPRLPNPFGAPGELAAALRVLPRIAENTRSMARDTKALAEIKRDMAKVAERTEGITTIDARLANIEATMPVLVDVRKDVAAVPDLIARLDTRIEALSVLLDELAKSVEGLQRSITPLGRLAGRLPGSSKPGKHELVEPEQDPRQ